MTICIVTISDRASRGEYEDRSGPEIVDIVSRRFPESTLVTEIVPDEIDSILGAFSRHGDADFILTTGGTGISDRDVTPEATRSYCDREVPGIAEMLRAESYKETPMAVLSRGVAGTRGKTMIVNFPGSVKAVRLCTTLLIPVMEHAIRMALGQGH